MTNFTNLRVFNEARNNIQNVAELCTDTQGFGDLLNQIKRSSISVVSNIAEGCGSSSIKQKLNFLGIARASNNELTAQILILSDLNPNKDLSSITNNIQYVGKMLTRLIQSLKSST